MVSELAQSKLSLKWDNHHSALVEGLEGFLKQNKLVDVTLAAVASSSMSIV